MACSRWFNELPSDILVLILNRLSIPDYFSIAGVCNSWRSVLLANRFCCPARPPPWMFLISRDVSVTEIPISSALMCLQREPLKLSSPRPQFLNFDYVLGSWAGFHAFDYILGSSAGWFVIFIPGISRPQLLNPISNQRIPLSCTTDTGVVLKYMLPSSKFYFSVHSLAISSAPTASDECRLAVSGIFNCNPLFAWCSPGDMQWSTFEPKNWTARNNQMVFNKGKLYIVAGDGGSVVAYSFDGRRRSMVAAYASDPNPTMTVAPLPAGEKRFVASGGEILCLVWCFVSVDQGRERRTVKEVYRWACGRGWARLESLGDRVLLIGSRGAESFCTKDLMGSGFEANCIYYHHEAAQLELFKFSMADGSTVRIPVPPDGKRLIGFEWIFTQQ